MTLNNLIVTEFEDFVTYWNNHCIRKNSGTEAPSGIPIDMFDMPEEFGKNYNESMAIIGSLPS